MTKELNTERLQSLLGQIAVLVKQKHKANEEKQRRGENFNVFSVLGLYHQEVRLHSAFIAELLNPRGAHGLGDALLVSFLKQIGLTDLKIESSQCIVTVEFWIAEKTDESGGRIDILIETPESAIIIENKIFAGDQPKQLLRYYNYASSKRYKNGFKLVYLTLDGASPSADSTGNGKVLEDDIICVSYKMEILCWLGEAIGTSAQHPKLRETIVQYVEIIKKLTGQNMEKESENALLDILLTSEDTIHASFIIEENLWKLKRRILAGVEKFQKDVTDEINKAGEFKISGFKLAGDFAQPQSGFSFYIEGWRNHWIKFTFGEKYYKRFYYGIVANNGVETLSKIQLESIVGKLNGYRSAGSGWWTCEKYPEDEIFRDHWQAEAFVSIAKNDKFKQLMKKEVENLLKATAHLDM